MIFNDLREFIGEAEKRRDVKVVEGPTGIWRSD